jgi:hypothetical protein
MIMRDVGKRWFELSHGWAVAVSLVLAVIIAALGWWIQRNESRAVAEKA